jgi:hypothetical protein
MEKDKLKRYLLIAGIVFGVFVLSITYFFLLYRNQSIGASIASVVAILRPLIIGAVLAYIMKSTCNFYEKNLMKLFLRSGKHKESKLKKSVGAISVVLTYITWIALITILLVIAIPQIIKSITDFANLLIVKIPEYVDFVIEWEQKFLEDQEMLRPYFDKVVTGLEDWATTDLIPCAIILICIIEGSQKGSLFALISSCLYVFSGSAAGAYCLILITFLAIFVCIFRQGYLQKGFAAAMLCTVFAVAVYEAAVFIIGYLLGLTILDRWIGFAVTGGLSILCAPILYPIILSIASIGGDTWKE